MRHLYTGLLFFGASCSAHAAETHKHSHAVKHAPVAMHYSLYAPEAQVRDSVVSPTIKSDNPNFSPPQLVAPDRSAAALTQSQRNLANVLNALLHQRMNLQTGQMKLSYRPGSAEMETEHLNVAVRSDSTSITWHTTF